jgi:hypothetical protein
MTLVIWIIGVGFGWMGIETDTATKEYYWASVTDPVGTMGEILNGVMEGLQCQKVAGP